jgi:DNA-binding LacI/PurR family transcriptional regulator/DNA-binding transcriptional regulator YhcF (GntR family)
MDTVTRAYKDLKRRIVSGEWTEGERLPRLDELANNCGVSRIVMWKAMDRIRKESLLHTRGKFIICGSATAERQDSLCRGLAWERLKRRIGQEILAGIINESTLHPLNKSALHYGVSMNTLKKALNRLVHEGLLITKGRRFGLPSRDAHYHLSTIVLITAGISGIDFVPSGGRTLNVIEGLERESLKYSLKRVQIGFDDHDAGSLLALSGLLKKIPDVAGFIVNIWNPNDTAIRSRWFDLFRYLASRKLPVVVIDQAGDLTIPSDILKSGIIKSLRIAGIRAGEMVGEHLLRNGHRHIAYVAPNYNYQWAQDRYTGLNRFAKQYAGRDSEVVLYAQNEIVDLSDLVLDLLRFSRERIQALFGAVRSAEEVVNIMKRFENLKDRRLIEPSKDDARALTIRSEAHHLCSLAKQTHDPHIFAKLFDGLYERASTFGLELYMQPFFKHILTDSRVTAWVCSDDKVALLALPFLVQTGIAVPGRIALAGFNNWPDDYIAGLTSYEFSMDSMIRQALLMIMDKKYFKTKPWTSEVDGYVVERRTTRAL